MGVIKKFTDLARFVGATTTACVSANKLQKERDPAGIERLCAQAEEARAKANANDTWGGFAESGVAKNPAWSKINNYVEMTTQAARAFAKQDYENAFDFACARMGLKDPASAFVALNLAVDALGQVKTRAFKNNEQADYQARFGESEIEILAAANRAVALNDPTGSKTPAPTAVKVIDPTHGLSMGAAYLNFVGGNLAEAARWVDASVARSGAEPILKREIGEPEGQFWFYDQTDIPAMNQFRSFLARRLQPKPSGPGM